MSSERIISELERWETVGEIRVDTGVLIGDPSYFDLDLSLSDNYVTQLGPGVTQLNYSCGHPGHGIVLSGGLGDGFCHVEVRRLTPGGRITEMRIRFITDTNID